MTESIQSTTWSRVSRDLWDTLDRSTSYCSSLAGGMILSPVWNHVVQLRIASSLEQDHDE